MKKIIYLCSFFVLLASTITAQENGSVKQEIIWSEASKCSEKNSEQVRSAGPSCTYVETDNGNFAIVSYGKITLAVSWFSGYDFARATIQLTNQSGKDLTIDPLDATIDTYKERGDFYLGTVRAIATAKAITGRDAKDRVDDRRTSLSNGPIINDNLGVRPNLQAKTTVERSIDPKGNAASEQIRVVPKEPSRTLPTTTITGSKDEKAVFDSAIKMQTIQDKDKIAGYIFFSPIRKRGFEVLNIRVGSLIFIFPQRVKPNR